MNNKHLHNLLGFVIIAFFVINKPIVLFFIFFSNYLTVYFILLYPLLVKAGAYIKLSILLQPIHKTSSSKFQ